MRNNYVIRESVKLVITNLNLSKTSSPGCILKVPLKNCKPELSYTLVKFFKMCLKESGFPDYWKFPSAVHVFKSVEKRSMTKSYRSVNLLCVVSKIFEKLVSNRFIDYLEKYCFCMIFSMVLGLLDHLQIFWHLYLIEMPGFLIGWRLLKL